MFLKTSYEKYLRREYSIPKDKNIVIKRGFVISKYGELLDNENSTSDPFKIRKLVYKDIENETSKIYGLIEKASRQIDDLLRLRESVGDENEQIYDLQIELAVDGLFSELSNSMRDLTNKAYKSFIFRLNESSKDSLERFEYLCNYALRDKEIYVKINLWVENLKKWFLENMESNLYGETNPVLVDDPVTSTKFWNSIESKGFFSDVLGSVEEFFSSLKDKIDRLIFNIVSFVQTEIYKILFKSERIEEYKIVLSDNDNTCNKCLRMSGKVFNIADMSVGSTAPPFHPNCECAIVPYKQAEKDGSLREQAFISANIALELLAQIGPLKEVPPSIYNWIKSSIWMAGALYLESINCPLAKEMYRLGMYGEGKGMSEKATSLMIEAMKKSKHLQEKILKLTESGKDFDTGDMDFEFKKDEDMDLYYAVQNVNMRIIGTNLGNDLWNIKIKVWDVYDFTTFRNSLSFADLANNLGEAMQRNGMMTEYDTYTEYEYIWKRG